MAKSMRSKFKRKQRAIKREKYEAREIEKLKKITARIQLKPKAEMAADGTDIKMEEVVLEDINAQSAPVESTDEIMVIDETTGKKLRVKDLKNQHGNYPSWMNQRRVKQLKGQKKASKSGSKSKLKKHKRLR